MNSIIRSVEKAVAGSSSFDITLKGLGTFPHERQPKVLWLGVGRGKEALVRLQKEVDRALGKVGFQRDRRAFHPHLTLARIRSMRGVEAMMDVVHSHRAAEAGTSVVDHLTLYQSLLSPAGAAYEVVHRWNLPVATPESRSHDAVDDPPPAAT